MARFSSSSSSNWSSTTSTNEQKTQNQSTTKNVLDNDLLTTLLAGLTGSMSDEEIAKYAENLLAPIRDAELEASRQGYEATKLSNDQMIENLAASLAKGIEGQQAAYRQNMANVETAALARGMGRSSYTMQTLANQGNALAQAVMQLTDENARQSAQVQQQTALAAQQAAQTQGRVNTDYAKNLAAKVQELKDTARKEHNQNYLTASSMAMGQQTSGTSHTTGSSYSETMGGSQSSSTSGSTGSKKNQNNTYPINNS